MLPIAGAEIGFPHPLARFQLRGRLGCDVTALENLAALLAMQGDGGVRQARAVDVQQQAVLVGEAGESPGPKLIRVLDSLLAGRVATIAGVRCSPGPRWRFALAPARRSA